MVVFLKQVFFTPITEIDHFKQLIKSAEDEKKTRLDQELVNLIIKKRKNMNYLLGYYVLCIVYCFYQLNKKYKKRGIDYGTSPELDSIMVLIMAWVLAPIDVSLTWIRMVKEAEEAKRRAEKFDLGGKELLNEEDKDSIY